MTEELTTKTEQAKRGKELLKWGRDEVNQDLKNCMTAQAKALYLDLAQQRAALEAATLRVKLLERKKAAIEAGEFSIDVESFTIKYEDDTLNEGTISVTNKPQPLIGGLKELLGE